LISPVGDLTYDTTAISAAGNKIIWPYKDMLYLINGNDGSSVWQYDLDSFITTSPSIANGMVFIGAQNGKLYAFR